MYAGTLNQDGALTIRTEAVGEQAYVGQIGRLLDALEEERAPIVRVADRYAKYFTPAILLVSSGTWLISGNISAALAVLIIACPCALVLATPTAIVAGVANAARQGILIKGGARFEAAGAVDTVAVDKTGTLTLGAPVVQQVIPMDGVAAESSAHARGGGGTLLRTPARRGARGACDRASAFLAHCRGLSARFRGEASRRR